MASSMVSLDKNIDRTDTNTSFFAFQQKASDNWGKRGISVRTLIDKSYNEKGGRVSRTYPKGLGIFISEYGKANKHIPTRNREITGGAFIGLSSIQRKVTSYLFEDKRIIKIYLDSQSIKDNFIVITDKEYSMFSLDLADKYWELFDEFQVTYPTYTFEFEHFSKEENPAQTQEMKVMFPGRY